MPLPYVTPAQVKQLEKQVENLRQQGSEIGGDIPTKLSQLENDTGYITSTALAPYALKTELPDVSNFITAQALEPYALKSEVPDVSSFVTQTSLNNLIQTVDTSIQIGNSEHEINLNGNGERPTYNSQEQVAFVSDFDLMPLICTMPFRKISGYLGDDGTKFSKETVLGWFGVSTIAELKSAIINKPVYLMYGISLSTNPMYYHIPCQYVAFTANNKLELITDGLDTNNDKLSRYKIVFTFVLDSEATVEDTEIAITVDDYLHLPELPEDADTKTYQLKAVNGTLTWVE